MPIPTSTKRNCSERSPLEGNPQKRQCETIVPGNITESAQQTSSTQILLIEEQAEGTTDTPTRCYKILEKEAPSSQLITNGRAIKRINRHRYAC